MEAIGISGLTWNGTGRSEEYLRDLGDNIDQYYEEDPQEKERGGTRLIQKPSCKLSVVQERIHNTYLQGLEWPAWLFGAGDGRAQRENAEAHLGLNHHFVTDIFGFYPSVDNDEVYEVFESKLDFTPDAASLATRLTTYQGNLPQGTTTSPRLADLTFLDVDRRLSSFCKSRGITYTRYADDLTFSASHSFESEISRIKEIVSGGNFRLHDGEKTGYKVGPIEVTGIVVTNNKLFAPPRLKERLRETDPGSPEWQGTVGYIQYVEPGFEVEATRVDSVTTIGPS